MKMKMKQKLQNLAIHPIEIQTEVSNKIYIKIVEQTHHYKLDITLVLMVGIHHFIKYLLKIKIVMVLILDTKPKI